MDKKKRKSINPERPRMLAFKAGEKEYDEIEELAAKMLISKSDYMRLKLFRPEVLK